MLVKRAGLIDVHLHPNNGAPCRPRASAYLKRRMLSRRLSAHAERHVGELEETPVIDLAKLGEALELLKMAKLPAMRRTPRRTRP